MRLFILRFIMIIFIGVISTAFMDLLSIPLYYVSGIPVEWKTVGLLVITLLDAINILEHTPSSDFDNAVGWITHYITGIFYAGLYIEIYHRLLKKPIFSIHVFYFTLLLLLIPFCLIAPLEGYAPFYIGSDQIAEQLSYTFLLHLFYSFGLIFTTYLVHQLNLRKHLEL